MSSMSTPNNRRPSGDAYESGVAPAAPRKRPAVARSDRVVPAMPPPQALAERDSAALLLDSALKEIRNLTQQAAHLAELQEEAETRADAYERAYHDAFGKLAAHERWECAAQCCDGPVTELLFRLVNCRHFVCQSYINAKVRARRNTVGVASNAEEGLRIPCPVCAGVPQNVNVFAPAIPFTSDISPMGPASVSHAGVNELLQRVSECADLASFAEGRTVRDRALAMQPNCGVAMQQPPSPVWVREDSDDDNDSDFEPRVRVQIARVANDHPPISPSGDFV